MALCSLYEVQYIYIKSTTKDGDMKLDKECLVLADSLREAEDKFNKIFINKRGTAYEVTGINKFRSEVIK